MAHLYCVAENTGKGFITHEDSRNFYRSGHPGNVWVIENNTHGQAWVTRKEATLKTLVEAQAIVDGVIQTAIDAWVADNVDGETADQKVLRLGEKPVIYALPNAG
jgi:hypothetical protein